MKFGLCGILALDHVQQKCQIFPRFSPKQKQFHNKLTNNGVADRPNIRNMQGMFVFRRLCVNYFLQSSHRNSLAKMGSEISDHL